ncbi:MAG: pheT [Gammaproteobacteria bacterium]|jgi:phenylalanyl-tRNA synthetase beta chain|nr:pheT [Gammaproteobacteria bacterium]
MKLSELWLREWIDPAISTDELSQKLTLSGLEVEALIPVAEKFSNVVIAQIVELKKHPDADRLHVCEVDVGQAGLLTIVCGGTNLKLGMKVPAALVGAVLPHNIKINRSKLRGIVSNGMLCSGSELTLTEDSKGMILEFAADAPIGKNVWDYLNLSDRIMDISITPNRGDCLSVLGIAREVAAVTACKMRIPPVLVLEPTVPDKLFVKVQAPEECPLYAGRVIFEVKADIPTPIWLQERLRRSGIRCISFIVDVMNYVMLELGQPMHAFDLQRITGDIQVRRAHLTEELQLLDSQTVKLNEDTLIIADSVKPLAIAGIMGGMESGVTFQTRHIFLESAFFQPSSIARTRQKYNLNSESSYRFERGVHPDLQVQALERATELILQVAGGQAGPIVEVRQQQYLPPQTTIQLRAARIHKIAGFTLEDAMIESFLGRLSFVCEKNISGWQVIVPVYRSDLVLEIDLIEEIIRLYGYEKLPLHHPIAPLRINAAAESKLNLSLLRNSLCHLGYHEAITYSFIDQKYQQIFDPLHKPNVLINPITTDMAVMRTNLWPGLVQTLLYNQNRQQTCVRLFEIGLRFIPVPKKVGSFSQQKVLSGLLSGTALPEQWGVTCRAVDFFDLKGDIENIIGSRGVFHFKSAAHPALHPGQTAEIQRAGRYVGILGALHPGIVQEIGLSSTQVLLFELLLDELDCAPIPKVLEISKFPAIRRDIAMYVDQTVPSQLIQDTIVEVGGELLKAINVFDVYQGRGVPVDHKSIALSLTLQHSSRTLLDEEVADVMSCVISVLKQKFAVELRG